MPDVFEYLDYRTFLKDDFEEKRGRNPHYSLRAWSEKLDLNVSSLTRILSNTRSISTALAIRFAEYLKLSRRQAEYFQLLVLYNQAKTLAEKKHHFERLLAHKGSKVKKIERELYQFFEKWYYVAVREIIDIYPFKDDYRELGLRLEPHITPDEAKAAVVLLEKLGFIMKNRDGIYQKTDPVISTGNDARAVALDNFQIEMLNLARRAVDHFPRETRSFSTLSLSISQKEYAVILDELREFRKRVLEIARTSALPDRIYQFNFQVFPLSSSALESR